MIVKRFLLMVPLLALALHVRAQTQPIIDMHLHPAPLSAFPVPPAVCAPYEEYPVWDPAASSRVSS